MLASSSTISRTEAVSLHTSLLLRGTRDGELAATLSSSTTISATRTPLFTWPQLTEIISSGQLSKLSRHPEDLKEYFAWMSSVKTSYGSVTNFLLRERFTATYLLHRPSGMQDRCFRKHFQTGKECQVLVNDWPYSVPQDVTHFVVWSCLPILHPDLLPSADETATEAWNVIAKRGLSGTLSPNHPPRYPQIQPPESQAHFEAACSDIIAFIQTHWDTASNEIAFFANPPSLQSVPSLAHFHVLVKPLT